MSRSYKKTPRSGDRKDKYFKRYANRRLRRMSLEHLDLKGKSYKKIFCSWNIFHNKIHREQLIDQLTVF